MKKERKITYLLFAGLILTLLISSLSFVSASWFLDSLNKITGKAINLNSGCSFNERKIPFGIRLISNSTAYYCDADGLLKEQKKKNNLTKESATCQNSYECESNVCSSGECIEVKEIIEEANAFKVTFVKVICRLSHLFDSSEDYSSCIYKYLDINETNATNECSPEALASGLCRGGLPLEGTPISECSSMENPSSINEPGVYSLERNLITTIDYCLDIVGENIVIDGKGHKILANNQGGLAGIKLYYAKNATIKNISIEGFTRSVLLDHSSDITLENVLYPISPLGLYSINSNFKANHEKIRAFEFADSNPIFENEKGKIEFIEQISGNGEDLNRVIKITNFSIKINRTLQPGFDKRMKITFKNISVPRDFENKTKIYTHNGGGYEDVTDQLLINSYTPLSFTTSSAGEYSCALCGDGAKQTKEGCDYGTNPPTNPTGFPCTGGEDSYKNSMGAYSICNDVLSGSPPSYCSSKTCEVEQPCGNGEIDRGPNTPPEKYMYEEHCDFGSNPTPWTEQYSPYLEMCNPPTEHLGCTCNNDSYYGRPMGGGALGELKDYRDEYGAAHYNTFSNYDDIAKGYWFNVWPTYHDEVWDKWRELHPDDKDVSNKDLSMRFIHDDNVYDESGRLVRTNGWYLDPCIPVIPGEGLKPGPIIKGVKMYVPEDYKKEYYLDKGDSDKNGVGDYEEAGLKELKAEGKLEDIKDQSARDNITGIITEYDDLQVEVNVSIPNEITEEMLENYTVAFYVHAQEAGRNKFINSISLSDGSACKDAPGDNEYSRYKICTSNISKSPIKDHRGLRVFAEASIKKKGETVKLSYQYSKSFVVVKYVLHIVRISTDSIGNFYNQYSFFSDLSDANKYIKTSFKYVEHTKELALTKDVLQNLKGTKLIGYMFEKEILKRKSWGSGSYSKKGLFDYDYDVLVAYSSEEITRAMCNGGLGCTFDVPMVLISKTGKRKGTLAHELGHNIGGLLDEYNLVSWSKQGGIISKDNNINEGLNPQGIDGTIHFPWCCIISATFKFDCWYYGVNEEGTVQSGYIWAIDTGPAEFGYKTALFEKVDDSYCIAKARRPCGPGSFDKHCTKPVQSQMVPGNCGDIAACKGMPYRDTKGNVPDDINLETTTEKAAAFSIMGNSHACENDKCVYPENSGCPLKNCEKK